MSLPSGYAQMAYIKSSGAQYIDTGVAAAKDLKVEAIMDVDKSNAWIMILGDYTSSKYFSWWANGNLAYAYFGSKNGTLTFSAGKHTYIADGPNNKWEIDGTSITLEPSSSDFSGTGGTLYLFSVHNGGSYTMASAKLYSCKIYKNGTLIRDFVPCRNASGTLGLYDITNNRFYGNAGSGDFEGPYYGPLKNSCLIDGATYQIKNGKVLIGETKYQIMRGRTLVNGTAYDITFAPTYDSVFANNTWQQIIEACHNNAVPDTWNVADQKPMTINGVDYQIDIIGKNHDTYASGGKAPLTFQLHDCYAETKAMNSSSTNSGGWKNSAMRTTHLPAILALMPTEVRSGIREVSKKASVGGASSTIETVSDKLFLLSEVEIFGSTSNSAAGEGTQYDYYKAGNSKVKKRNGSAAAWWERSPVASSSAHFCLVNNNGSAGFSFASNARSVAFGFCF